MVLSLKVLCRRVVVVVVPLLKIVNFAAPAGTTVELLAGKRMSAIVGENTFQKSLMFLFFKKTFFKT